MKLFQFDKPWLRRKIEATSRAAPFRSTFWPLYAGICVSLVAVVIFDRFWNSEFRIGESLWHIHGTSPTTFWEKHFVPGLLALFLLCVSFWGYAVAVGYRDRTRHQMALVRNSKLAAEEATQKLEAQKDFLRNLIDGLPAMIAYWDSNKINVLSNFLYQQNLGRDERWIQNKSMAEVLGESRVNDLREHIDGVLSGRPQLFERTAEIQGTIKHLLVNYHPDIRDGKVQGFISSMVDVTRLKELEKENLDKQAQLFSKSKMSLLGEMASGIAHEINNPLAIISGSAQVVRLKLEHLSLSGPLKSEIQNSLGHIEKTTNRIASIIRGLRAFARNSDAVRILS